MAEFPQTVEAMKEAGYTNKDQGTCKDRPGAAGCGATIDWWLTRNGKHIPMDGGTATAHFKTCPNAGDFRGGSSTPKGTDDDAEVIASRFVRSGSCRFDGEAASLRVQIGRDFAFLCLQHGEELKAKMDQWSNDAAEAPSVARTPDREPGSDDEPPFDPPF